jgi:hypothetical protein
MVKWARDTAPGFRIILQGGKSFRESHKPRSAQAETGLKRGSKGKRSHAVPGFLVDLLILLPSTICMILMNQERPLEN